MKTRYKFFVPLLVFLLFAGCESTQPEVPAAGKTLYATVVRYSGEDESWAKYLEIAGRSQELFPLLEEQVNAFAVNAYNYQDIDGEGTPLYTMNTLRYPEEIAPNGRSIQVSRNYFRYFPVETAEGKPVEELLTKDENTLDILVPQAFQEQEDDILKAYREQFYFEKVQAENSYNEEAGIIDRLELSPQDLNVHIIYVKDGQRYCLLRADLVTEDDGWITDPIVSVYSGNIHCNYAHSLLSQWTYFYADTSDPEEAFEWILPAVKSCGAEESFQEVEKADWQEET